VAEIVEGLVDEWALVRGHARADGEFGDGHGGILSTCFFRP
jgi:hypothetical protein